MCKCLHLCFVFSTLGSLLFNVTKKKTYTNKVHTGIFINEAYQLTEKKHVSLIMYSNQIFF